MSGPHDNTYRGVHFDPTINLGHLMTATVFLASTIAAWISLNARVEQTARDVDRVEKASVSVENRMMVRINEERARLDQTQVRIADDIREIKGIVRDGFHDLDNKLDRKADKPGSR